MLDTSENEQQPIAIDCNIALILWLFQEALQDCIVNLGLIKDGVVLHMHEPSSMKEL